MSEPTVPLQLEPIQPTVVNEKRLWIGNLDPRVNEYQLLKIVRTYGNIEKLDMMFHRTGPHIGWSRGFAFVTYKLRQDAIKAMNSLNGQTLGTKKISVKFAKNMNQGDDGKSKPELAIPALRGVKEEEGTSKVSIKTTIQAIEAKLKLMENMKAGDDFVVNKLAATEPPIVALYQNRQMQPKNKSYNQWRRKHPYHRNR